MRALINIIAIWFLLFLPATMLGQEELTEYLKIAAKNNPYLKSKFNQYMAAMEKVPQVGALPDPQLAFSYFVMPVETRLGPQQFKLSLTQRFPWFGTLKARKGFLNEMALAKYEVFENEKNSLFIDVKSTYYNYYVLEKAIGLTQDNLAFLRSIRDLALRKYESGKSSMVDVLRVDIEIAELENQLALLQDTRVPLVSKLEQLLNTQLNGFILLPDTLWSDSLAIDKSSLLDSIIENNPLLRQFDHLIAGFENQEVVAKKAGSPNVMLGLDYINIGNRTDMDVPDSGKDALIFPMVGISLPIYRSKYKGMINEAGFNRNISQQERENTVNLLKTNLEMGYRDYLDAIRRVSLNQKLLRIATHALDLLVSDYSSAGKDLEEVLRMERLILKYALELEKTRADQNQAVAYLEMLMAKQ